MRSPSLIIDHPMFALLEPQAREEIDQLAVARSFSAREFIVHEGDVWPNFFMVLRGEVAAVKESMDGRALTATILKPGEVFWGLAFFHHDAEMPVSLIAQSDVTLQIWRRADLVPMIQAHGEMSWILCQLMMGRMVEASEIVEGLAFQPVLGRLAGLVLDMFGDAEDEFRERFVRTELLPGDMFRRKEEEDVLVATPA